MDKKRAVIVAIHLLSIIARCDPKLPFGELFFFLSLLLQNKQKHSTFVLSSLFWIELRCVKKEKKTRVH